jgi:hypothetical protein
VDEVHERDIYTDFLLTCLRGLLPARPDLKIIIMSATLQVDLLARYWGTCVQEAHAVWQAEGAAAAPCANARECTRVLARTAGLVGLDLYEPVPGITTGSAPLDSAIRWRRSCPR